VNQDTAGWLRFARALRSRPFALLWAGQAISALGDGAFYTALAWTVLLLTHSGTAMGIVAIAQIGPGLVFLLLGGVAADRLPRRLVLLWSDGGRGLVVLVIAALGWLGLLQFWHLVVLALLFGIADGFFAPAYQAIPPQLVAAEMLPSANALTGLSRQLGQLAGPALGAAFVALTGPASAFAFDGLTFVVSAGCLFVMRLPTSANAAGAAGEGAPAAEDAPAPAVRRPGFGGVVADVREGLAYITGSTWLWATIVIAAVANMGYAGAAVVALPKLVHDFYGQGVWLLGVLGTANAVGSLTGTLVVGQARQLRRRGLLAYLATSLASVALIVYGLPLPHGSEPAVASAAAGMEGFGLGVFQVIWLTVLQELVPTEKLGRVSSIDWLGSLGLLPIGYALVGVLTDRFGPAWVFIGAGALALVLNLIGLSIRGIRQLQ
jgi:MFS family permease